MAGPGSLYTSVLPNLLVREIWEAVRRSPALKIYVCNVATQLGETEHYTVGEHMRALESHVGPGFFDHVLANDNFSVGFPPSWSIELVPLERDAQGNYQLITADVIDTEKPWRHDPQKLARSLMDFYVSHQRG